MSADMEAAIACERILADAEAIAMRADRYPWDVPQGLTAYLQHVAATLADMRAEFDRVLPEPQCYGSAPTMPLGGAAYVEMVRRAGT